MASAREKVGKVASVADDSVVIYLCRGANRRSVRFSGVEPPARFKNKVRVDGPGSESHTAQKITRRHKNTSHIRVKICIKYFEQIRRLAY